MPKLQRDIQSHFGNEVGAELNLLFSHAASLGVSPSPNTRTKQTSTGTVLEFVNRDGAKASDDSEPEVTEQWFKLVPPETGKPTGYKLPLIDRKGVTVATKPLIQYEGYPTTQLVGVNQLGLGNPDSDDWYGNRQGLKVHLMAGEPWQVLETKLVDPNYSHTYEAVVEEGHHWTPLVRDYIQLDEVAGLGLPCDKEGELLEGREEEYTWIAPPPIPLNCINPILYDGGYNAEFINWLDYHKWGKPVYKYGDTIEECTRSNDAFYQHNNYSIGNTLNHLHYPCFNELYGNGTYGEYWTKPDEVVRRHMLMYGWDYWHSLFLDAYVQFFDERSGLESEPKAPWDVPYNRDVMLSEYQLSYREAPSSIIKAVKLPSPIKFGSQNAVTEVIECNWMDSNEAGRIWTATNNYLDGKELKPSHPKAAWQTAFPELIQYKQIPLLDSNVRTVHTFKEYQNSPFGFNWYFSMGIEPPHWERWSAEEPYFLHNRHRSSNFIKRKA